MYLNFIIRACRIPWTVNLVHERSQASRAFPPGIGLIDTLYTEEIQIYKIGQRETRGVCEEMTVRDRWTTSAGPTGSNYEGQRRDCFSLIYQTLRSRSAER